MQKNDWRLRRGARQTKAMTDEKTIAGPVLIVGTYNACAMSFRIIPPPVFSLTVDDLTLSRFLDIVKQLEDICYVSGTCSVDLTISKGVTSICLPKLTNSGGGDNGWGHSLDVRRRGKMAFELLFDLTESPIIRG